MSKVTFPQAGNDFVKYNGAPRHTEIVGESLTRQEFKDECDINSLMARYDTHVIGGPGNLPPAQPFYADFTLLPDSLQEFHSFMDMVSAEFMRLPAVVRREFENDPVKFCDYASDPVNLPRMREWGLAAPEKVPDAPMKVEVVNASPSPEPAPGPAKK